MTVPHCNAHVEHKDNEFLTVEKRLGGVDDTQ